MINGFEVRGFNMEPRVFRPGVLESQVMTHEDDEIAALYRGPLAGFTAARNALAKQRGPAGAAVRTLEKPHAAAWAVNQLYWHRRQTYDAVIAAAASMRDAHARMLSGRQADVADAEASHRAAIKTAIAAIGVLAQAAGEALSAATLDAASETLQALPSDTPAGQLTRPLKPLGFSALMSLSGVLATSRPSAPKAAPSGAKGQSARARAAEQAAAKKAAVERAARRKVLQTALSRARARERAAESALAASKKALAKAERDLGAARDRLVFLEKQRDDAEQRTRARAQALREAGNLRTQAEQDLHATGE